MKDWLLRTLKLAGFAAVNFWLAFHVFAIFISPAGMPPASPLLVDISRVALPYNQAMFLNHGYHYFAPDPGPSTLVAYEIPQADDVSVKGQFPTTDLFPRLLYHRYFMLAENFRAFPEETQNKVLTAYARHFSRKHGANEISLRTVGHEPSSITRIRAGGQLADEETYFENPIGTYRFSSDSDETGVFEAAADNMAEGSDDF